MRIGNINNYKIINYNQKLSFKNLKENQNTTPQITIPFDLIPFNTNIYNPISLSARTQPNMKDFFNFLDGISIEGKCLSKEIKDYRFAYNQNFDVKAWENFISEMNESVAVMDSTNEEKSFLSKLLELYPISELLNLKTFNPNKAIEFLDTLYDRSDEEISQIPFSAQLDFMVDAASSDKNINEYINDMFYFVKLEDNNGDKFLSERAEEMDRTQVGVIQYLLCIDKGSVEASNIQMLLELIQNGVVDKHVFDVIPYNGKISTYIIEDIDKLYNAYISGIKPIDFFVPTFRTKDDAELIMDIGDVYELKGQDYIYIIDKNGKSVQLKIDKDTFFELFPPIERFASTQNDIGNCWEITGFNTIFCDPQERISILSLYEQDDDDILISFPSGNSKKTRFEGGELPTSAVSRFYSKGSKGIQLFEYAHAIEIHEEQINTLKQQIQYSIDNAKTPERKKELEEKMQVLEEMLEEDRENVVVELNPQTFEWSFELRKQKPDTFDNAITATRDGGDPIILFKHLGYTTTNIKDDDLKIYTLISNPQNFEDYIITFGTKEDNFFEQRKLPILNDHSYRLYPTKIDSITGKVTDFKLVDPSGIVEIPVNIMELRKFSAIYSVARRDKTNKSRINF